MRILLLMVGLLLLAGCSNAEKEKPIAIGVILSITGDAFSDGIAVYNGLRMATNDINENGGVLGRSLDMIVLDDANDTDQAVLQYEELKRQGVHLIIGSAWSNSTLAIAEQAERDGIPMIVPTATNNSITLDRPNIFRVTIDDFYQANILSRVVANSLNPERVAIIYDETLAYAVDMDRIFYENIQESGAAVLLREGFPTGQIDYQRIAREIIELDIDMVFLPNNPSDIVDLVEEIYELGAHDIKFVGGDSWSEMSGYIRTNDAFKNAYFSNKFYENDPNDTIQDFISRYESLFNHTPTSYAIGGYDAVRVLADALNRAGSLDNDSIIRALDDTNMQTVLGQLTFNSNNNPEMAIYILTFENGSIKLYYKYMP